MSNALKFLLLAVGCIIVVGLISLGIYITDKGKTDATGSLAQYSSTAGESEDVKLRLYDNTDVLGSEIVKLIREYDNHDYISIVVDTAGGNPVAYVNPCRAIGVTPPSYNTGTKYSALPKEKIDSNYINEAGTFHSAIYYDENDVLACIWFDQAGQASEEE